MNGNGTDSNKSFAHIKHRASLLNVYFRLTGFQSSLLLICIRYGLISCSHCDEEWQKTIQYVKIHFQDQRGAASRRNQRSCVWTEALSQPPPQALRFSHGRGERETSDWWWTARDHGKGTDARCLLPAFLCAHIFIKRETSGYEAEPYPIWFCIGTSVNITLDYFKRLGAYF